MTGPGTAPIFYDPTRRRRPLMMTLALLLSLAGTVFCISLVLIPLLPAVKAPKLHFARDLDLTTPAWPIHPIAERRFVLKRDEARLARLVKQEQHSKAVHLAAIRAAHHHVSPTALARPVVAAFYVDSDDTSLASLKEHAPELTHLMPEWLHLRPDAASFDSELKIDAPGDPSWEALQVARKYGLAVVPLLNNYDGQWNSGMLHRLLVDPAKRTALIGKIRSYLLQNRLQGINIDFEEAPADDADRMTAFMQELHDSLCPAGLLVTQDVPADDDTYQLPELAECADFLMPMLYDEHYSQSAPGPIASQGWFEHQLDQVCAKVPASKLVLSLGNYAYDWQQGAQTAESKTFQGAIVTAEESTDEEGAGQLHFDPSSLNPHYSYFDDDNKKHQVWMLDAVTAYNQWRYARAKQPLGVGLWYLGSEDPSLWSFYSRSRLLTPTDPQSLARVHYGFQIDFEGEGELLRVLASQREGERRLTLNPNGMITHQQWDQLPSSIVIRRWGHDGNEKKIALTFDDGPDRLWTPRILDILKQEGVHATFFVIGQNAEANPRLIRRLWDEGNEIGNHSFTHPNLSETSPARTDLELNATQRAIESLTGHSTPLFRPPYEADAEPTEETQVVPIRRAQALGYVMVGESIDPLDWDTLHHVTATKIVQRVRQDLGRGNCILLHDGGGNRSQTAKALPLIIDGLKARGYQFVTVSELMKRPRPEVFPAVTGRDRLLVGADRFVFDSAYRVDWTLRLLFMLSIVFGLTRVVGTGTMAVIQSRRARGRCFEPEFAPRVSVIIAAYNEARVINRTIETVLVSDYPNLEVVVMDDGSKDDTAEVVRKVFASDPRVRVFQQENEGKAAALNHGLEFATGEVIVALDADTLFDSNTIGRLVRHFADPHVGAVAGNVKVGNATNVLTRWQAIEYITSQNFDRRAYDLLNCITVVPGAVGAWRKGAIEKAGGYSGQTLAEDTDLTWTIRKLGYRIVTENEAMAYTEAPDGLRALAKQRFRWAFGTLQNLWKHRDALLNPRYGAFGMLALPGLWLYQILFQAIAPAVDLMILSSLWMGDVQRVLFYYAVFFVAELAGALLAFTLEREDKRMLVWMFWQRFVYRQLMYYVLIKSLLRALGGASTGWGKLERKGTSRVREQEATG